MSPTLIALKCNRHKLYISGIVKIQSSFSCYTLRYALLGRVGGIISRNPDPVERGISENYSPMIGILYCGRYHEKHAGGEFPIQFPRRSVIHRIVDKTHRRIEGPRNSEALEHLRRVSPALISRLYIHSFIHSLQNQILTKIIQF